MVSVGFYVCDKLLNLWNRLELREKLRVRVEVLADAREELDVDGEVEDDRIATVRHTESEDNVVEELACYCEDQVVFAELHHAFVSEDCEDGSDDDDDFCYKRGEE